jgi:cbb3-type cytochrome oxidase subunit 3
MGCYMGENAVFIVFILVFVASWIWVLIDVVISEFKESNDKLLWGLFVFFLPLIGVLAYFFIGRKLKSK